tara:strand:+ start:58 stop:402 length:345 start_codon:yes stop_codon:yes gene_type:complete
MDYKEKVLKHYKIEFTDDSWNNLVDLSVYRNMTSDGYDIWMINHEGGLNTDHNIDWEHDVFMYKDGLSEALFDTMKENRGQNIIETWYIEDDYEIFQDYDWSDEWEKINKSVKA